MKSVVLAIMLLMGSIQVQSRVPNFEQVTEYECVICGKKLLLEQVLLIESCTAENEIPVYLCKKCKSLNTHKGDSHVIGLGWLPPGKVSKPYSRIDFPDGDAVLSERRVTRNGLNYGDDHENLFAKYLDKNVMIVKTAGYTVKMNRMNEDLPVSFSLNHLYVFPPKGKGKPFAKKLPVEKIIKTKDGREESLHYSIREIIPLNEKFILVPEQGRNNTVLFSYDPVQDKYELLKDGKLLDLVGLKFKK